MYLTSFVNVVSTMYKKSHNFSRTLNAADSKHVLDMLCTGLRQTSNHTNLARINSKV
jgi:hypothetical protein